eukprot:TRINITY_DN19804_c0_g1_i1.p1 TRINITY_DN19804_c0_g1~~TRINITY_DN19804_c0_g1_i1.p1  ORF type:complete len:365 (-),score=92.73 TRINITY_DN19804_c0_g1_i1:268-1362(-)
MDLRFVLLVFSLSPLTIHGHGNMMLPTTWMDAGGKIGLNNQMNCGGVFSSCLWFTNFTFIAGKPTLDPSLWTYSKMLLSEPPLNLHDLDYTGCQHQGTKSFLKIAKKQPSPIISNEIPPLGDYFYNRPWRSPGSAKLHSPCGVLGGNPDGCPANAPYGEGNKCPGGGFGYGPRAEDYPFRDVVTTKWRAGSVVEVGWGINANHGGGYSYRLCKVPKGGRSFLTEKCFQETPLRFHGDMQWVQYGEDRSNRTAFRANRTMDGTFPAGSEWTKNPIPACAGGWGGVLDKDKDCKEGTQFDPPAPGLKGFGVHIDNPAVYDFHFTIIDQVQVPADLMPGDYVLSFRWDCEQTPQVWSACSSIKIKNN